MILYKAAPELPSRKKLILASVVFLFLFGIFIWQKDRLLSQILPQPIFVQGSGKFLREPGKVRLITPLSGEIRYTTDGSSPTSHSQRYESPLQIEQSQVLKFAVFQNGEQFTQTQTYDLFVGEPHTVPVLALTTEPENLWDEEKGIYVEGKHNNFLQSGKEWERPAELRFYEPDGAVQFSQTVAIRLQGNNMRTMPQKSFRVYVTDEDGRQKTLQYPLFGDEGNREYESFILRNGGGDSRASMLRDPLAARLVRESSELTTQLTRPVVLYLNGEYWGLYYLYERFDDTYFAQKYQVKRKALSVVEVPLDTSDKRGQVIPETKGAEQAAELYNKLLAQVKSCQGCSHYSQLEEHVDMDSLLDYLLFELFFSNIDWPNNNTKAWRYESEVLSTEALVYPELDGRFRWMFFDLDASQGFEKYTEEEIVASAQGDTYSKLIDEYFPFRNLFYNSTFRRKYRQRLDELTSTTLNPQYLEATVDEMAAEIRPEMPRYIERWGTASSSAGLTVVPSMEAWEMNVDLLKAYLRARPAAFTERTENFYRATSQ